MKNHWLEQSERKQVLEVFLDCARMMIEVMEDMKVIAQAIQANEDEKKYVKIQYLDLTKPDGKWENLC